MKTLMINNYPTNWFNPFEDIGFSEPEKVVSATQVKENKQETPFAYILEYIIPDMKKRNLKIKLDNNKLILEGYRKENSIKLFKKKESPNESAFITTNILSDDMDVDKIRARFKKGILLIEIPKKKEFITYREIPVSGSEKSESDKTSKRSFFFEHPRYFFHTLY